MQEAIAWAVNKPCPECGGQRVITDVGSRYIAIFVGAFSTTKTIPITCIVCGYTAFFAEDPAKVRKGYLKQ